MPAEYLVTRNGRRFWVDANGRQHPADEIITPPTRRPQPAPRDPWIEALNECLFRF